MITIRIHKIPVHLIWIFGLLEMITVPMVAGLPAVINLESKSVAQGAVVGFVGVILLFIIVNRILPRLKLELNNEQVKRISVLSSAIWNTLLLALIFGIQKLVAFIPVGSIILLQVISGFLSVAGAVIGTLLMYTIFSPRIPFLKIVVSTNSNKYNFKNLSVLVISALAGLYEAIALPIILIWQRADHHVALIAAATGLLGGIVGSTVIWVIYNYWLSNRLVLKLNKIS